MIAYVASFKGRGADNQGFEAQLYWALVVSIDKYGQFEVSRSRVRILQPPILILLDPLDLICPLRELKGEKTDLSLGQNRLQAKNENKNMELASHSETVSNER